MNKKFLVSSIILLLLVVSLSGCTENTGISSDDESHKDNFETEEKESEKELSDEEDNESSDDEDNKPDVEENQVPITPSTPYGPTIGNVGAEYTFSQSTTDPDGNLVKYRFDWGDGTYSDWSDLREHELSYSLSHSWNTAGTYQIRIQARDENGGTSEWSPSLQVEIKDTETQIIEYPKIVTYDSHMDNVNLRPTLQVFICWWVLSDYSNFEYPDLFLTWYVKQNGFWVDVKNIEIFNDGFYYHYFEDAGEYSTTYYWKVRLFDEHGITYDEKVCSFTTIDNEEPIVNLIEPCDWWPETYPLNPTATIEISDAYGDRMDVEWYLKKEGESWELISIDHSLTNGTYSCTLEGADEYGTDYDWKVKVTDDYGGDTEEECKFKTKTPSISISDMLPLDGETFYVYLGKSGSTNLTFNMSATVLNSEGNLMDIKFVFYGASIGTKSYKFYNVYNGTYVWNPEEKFLYYGDYPWFYVQVEDLVWGKKETSTIHHFDKVRRAWVQFSKDDGNNTLTVTKIEPSDFTWDEIEIDGIGTLPSGTIEVGDKITECNGEVSLYWSDVNWLIDTWTFS